MERTIFNKDRIAHGANTNSKRSSCFPSNYPKTILKSTDCYAYDEKRNRLIDYICSLGVNWFGASNIEINSQVAFQLDYGSIHSLTSDLECAMAGRISELFPFMEKVRFLKTGSEACSAAIRIARAYNGRDLLVTKGYHGWHDEFVSLTPPAKGIPPEGCLNIEELDLEDINYSCCKETAAVVIEPVELELNIQKLQNLRDYCTKKGIVLIYDETITAYRFPGFSVAKYTGIYPDIAILGKAIGGGLPLAVVGGKKEIMESDYFVSSTFSGDNLALAAAYKASELIKTTEYDPKNVWEKGKIFLEKFNGINPDIIRIKGYPTRGIFECTDLVKTVFFQEAIKAGILFGSSWFFNYHLSKETDNVIELCKVIINRIAKGEVKLEGEVIKGPFSNKFRS